MIALRKFLESIVEWTGIIFCFLAVPLCLLVVFEVGLRIISDPTIWSFEVSLILFGAHYFLLAAYGLKYKSHAVIDIFTSKANRNLVKTFQIISYVLLFFPFTIGLLIMSVPFAIDAWKNMETSWSMWGQPLYIVKSIMPIAMLLLVMQGIAEMIKIIFPESQEVKQ